MRFTSNDVAKLAGVSQSTVSRVFKGHGSISPKTLEKVHDAAKKLNYVPNSFARSLTTQKSNIVAIVIGNLKNSFYTESLVTFSRELQTRGKHLLLFSVEDTSQTDDAIRQIVEYQVDGIILTAAHASMVTAEMCFNRRIPVVTFNRYIPGTPVNSVRCDNVEGGRLITSRLLESGAQKFLVVYGEKASTTNEDRLEGFRNALDIAGVSQDSARLVSGNYTYDDAFAAVKESFNDGYRADAVLCLNDVMAFGAIDALRYEIGLSIPGDVMVTGFDDIAEASRPAYDLTTVRQPIEKMVQETLDLLGLGEGGESSTSLVRTLPAVLVERGTTKARLAPR